MVTTPSAFLSSLVSSDYSAVYLNPEKLERLIRLRTKDIDYEYAVNHKLWDEINHRHDKEGLPAIQLINPEWFPKVEQEKIPVYVFNKARKAILAKLDGGCIPKEVYNEYLYAPELTENIYHCNLHIDNSSSMKPWANLPHQLDQEWIDGLKKSAAYLNSKKQPGEKGFERNHITAQRTTFSHVRKILQLPTPIDEYVPMDTVPEIGGATDLYTMLATIFLYIQLADNTKRQVNTGAKEINMYSNHIVFSDGAHCWDESLITVADLKVLYKRARALGVFVGAVTCCPKAFAFYEEIGFKRHENIVFIKEEQDRMKFKENIRKAIYMMSNKSMAAISARAISGRD
jgi:hypothetical protein